MTGFPLALPLDVTAPRHFDVIQRNFSGDPNGPLCRVEIELLSQSELTAMRLFIDKMRVVPADSLTRRVPM